MTNLLKVGCTKLFATIALLAGLLFFSIQAEGAVTTYTGPTNGNWSVAGNWSNGLPKLNNDAVIPAGKTVLFKGLVADFTITIYGALMGQSGTDPNVYFLKTQKGLNNYGYFEFSGASLTVTGSNLFNYGVGSYISIGSNANVRVEYGAHIVNYGTFNCSAADNKFYISPNSGVQSFGGTLNFPNKIIVDGEVYGKNDAQIFFGAGATVKGRLEAYDGTMSFSKISTLSLLKSGTVTGSLWGGACAAIHQNGTISNQGSVNIFGAFYQKGTVTGLPVTYYNRNALFLTNGPTMTAGEIILRDKMISLGFVVTSKQSSNLVSSDLTGKRVVVMGYQSAAASAPLLKSAPVGIIAFGVSDWVQINLCPLTYKESISTTIAMTGANTAIGDGLLNTQTIFTNAKTIEASSVYGSGKSIAKINSGLGTAIFAYPKGAVMDADFVAPARRVGLGFLPNDFGSLTETGKRLFADAVEWASTQNCGENMAMRSNSLEDRIFSATKKVGSIGLAWNSLPEDIADIFQIQKLNNFSGQFETIFSVGRGLSKPQTFIDRDPESGENTYRLALTDLQGDVHFSAEESLDFSKEAQSFAFPNPADNRTTINLTGFIGKSQVRLEFIDFQGKASLVETIDGPIDPEQNVDISALRSGMYFVRISSDGTRPQTIKLIVAKTE